MAHTTRCSVHALAAAAALILFAGVVAAGPHEHMMRAVFKIEGKKKDGDGNEAAAAFAVAVPDASGTSGGKRIVLVTAAHFFDKIRGDRIELVGRRSSADGEFKKARHSIPIKKGAEKFWVRHSDEKTDVAVIELDWPDDCDVRPVRFGQLATTISIVSGAIPPGRSVFALGYPFAIEGTDAGFAVLRNGRIASFPPPRGSGQKTFLVDMAMFVGFSGSPVYATGQAADEEPVVLGMIFRQHELTSDFKGPFETRKVHYMLDLAVVLKAPIIRDLIVSSKKP